MFRRPLSLTATLVALLAAGLLLLQMAVFALTVHFRYEEQFRMAASDRGRLLMTLHQLMLPLSVPERYRMLSDLGFESFRLDLVEDVGLQQGTSDQSLFFLRRIMELYELSYPGSGLPDHPVGGLPRFVTRVENFSIDWQFTPLALQDMRNRHPRICIFDAAAAISFPEGDWLQVTYYTMPALNGNVFDLFMELLVQFLLQIFLAVAVIRYLMRPLARLADFADRITPEVPVEVPEGLPQNGPSEVMRTSQAFRAMYARMREYVAERVRLVASISHDLRTPITRLRLQLENEPSLSRPDLVFDALDDLQTLAEDAISLARTGVNSEPAVMLDLGSLLESMVADYEEHQGQPECLEDSAQCRVRLHLACRPRCRLRPQAFRRCLENLVDNALRYGEIADVYLEPGDRDSEVRIRIVDQGPGLPGSELEKVFQPFYRVEHSRNPRTGGTGLGLSIARDLAALVGVSLALSNAEPHGLCATLLIPATSQH